MSDYQGNIVIKNPATPTGPAENGSAPGIWKLSEVLPFVRQGIWPTQGIQAKDPFFPYVSLLLSTTSLGNANNNLFVDSSGAFNPVSRIGNTTQGSFTPYANNWSNYFDGTGDEVLAPNTPANFGSNNFTAECWVWFTSNTAGYQLIMGNQGSGDGQGWVVYTETNNQLTFAYSTTNSGWSGSISTGVTPSVGVWTHIAIVRNGTAITFYVNGVASGTPISTSSAIASPTGNFRIGRYPYFPGGARTINAYISNVRLVNGTAVYTSNFTPPTSSLTAISGTSLLTCQSNRFRDASTNNYTVTIGGNPSVQDFGPFAPAYPGMTGYNQSDITNWSNYFDGNGDYLTVPSSSAFNYGTGDFTIECWGYRGSSSNFWCAYSASGVSFTIFSYAGASETIQVYSNGFYNSGINPGFNTWFHVAVTRSSGTLRIFINGVQGFSGSYTTNIPSHEVRIGSSIANEWGLGNVSNLRVVKGTALYTSNFTPPTTNLTAVSGTSLLTCQNAAFTDNSTNSFVITPTGNTTVTGNSPFNTVGYWSNYFDGSSTVTFSQINMAGDFTIEGWAYFIGTNSPTLLGANPPNHQSLRRLNTGKHYFYREGVDIVGTIDVPLNQWVHLAATRSGGTVRIFTNGVLDGSRTITGTFSLFCLGGVDTVNDRLTGYTSNMRVVDGTALYTATFTPPTAPLTAVSGTALLTSQNGSFIDNSTSNRTLTRNGSPSVQSFDPFYTATIASNGGSMYFDGIGDYLSCPSNPAFNLGTANYTVEFFIYTSSTTNQMVFDTIQPGISGGGSNRLFVYISSSQQVVVGPGTNMLTSSSTIQLGAWNHVAVVRSGTTRTIYINGVSAGSNTQSEDLSSSFCTIGFDAAAGGSIIMNGYLSNLRLTKGTALYTANFTPPTAPLTPSANTSLLTNGMNAGIYDQTTINDMETVGNAQVRYPSPFAPANYWAGAFDGSGDYITSPDNAAVQFGSGDFTIEMWVYFSTTSGTQVLLGSRANTGVFAPYQFYYTGGVLYLYGSTNGSSWNIFNGLTIIPSVTAGQWYHVAVVRSGSNFSTYSNGVRQSNTTVSGSLLLSNSPVTIGADAGGANPYTGYISNLRMVKGTAVYDPSQTTLTVPTTPLTAVSGTSLLTCQNKTFIDNSTNAFTITAFGNATAGAIGPFTATGGTSVYFDGSGDYLNSPNGVVGIQGSVAYTLEAWIYPTSVSGRDFCIYETRGGSGWVWFINSTGYLQVFDSSAGLQTASTTQLSANQWYHVALVRQSGSSTNTYYVNGVAAGTFTRSSFAPASQVRIGARNDAAEAFVGYIDDLRVTNGVARYTANFTPPTQPFPIY